MPDQITPRSLRQVDWSSLNEFACAGDWVLFGCDMEINRRYGLPNAGAASFVRGSAALAELSPAGVLDLGLIAAADPVTAMRDIAATAARIIVATGAVPVLLACDHTASLAALSGCRIGCGEVPVYVYFDAHFDLGRNCAAGDALHNGGFVGEILRQHWAASAINIGGRAVGTTLDYPATPDFVSLAARMPTAAIVAELAVLAGRAIYVSIDADVLDPAEVPNVSCPEPDGMKGSDVLACCHWLGQHCRIIGADLCELVPSANSQQSDRLLLACLLALKQ